MKSQVLHTESCNISVVRLQRKFDVDHSWGVKGLTRQSADHSPFGPVGTPSSSHLDEVIHCGTFTRSPYTFGQCPDTAEMRIWRHFRWSAFVAMVTVNSVEMKFHQDSKLCCICAQPYVAANAMNYLSVDSCTKIRHRLYEPFDSVWHASSVTL